MLVRVANQPGKTEHAMDASVAAPAATRKLPK
jgi:hypothetical protein